VHRHSPPIAATGGRRHDRFRKVPLPVPPLGALRRRHTAFFVITVIPAVKG